MIAVFRPKKIVVLQFHIGFQRRKNKNYLQRPVLSTLSAVSRPCPSFMFLLIFFKKTLYAIWSCNEILTYRARTNIWGAHSEVQNNGKVPIYMCNSQTYSQMHWGYCEVLTENYSLQKCIFLYILQYIFALINRDTLYTLVIKFCYT